MAKQFTITGIATGQTIEAAQVSQSVQAFTGAEAYDIEDIFENPEDPGPENDTG